MDLLFIPPNQMSARRGTVPSLDGLRAVSILLVLGAHFVNSDLFPGGLGVYVFFVISGFLITRLLTVEHNDRGAVSIRLFYLRRILRLYPVILVFTVCVIALYVALGRPVDLIEPAAALAYFANYLYSYLSWHHIRASMPFGVFWSLSVEEHFYILFPILFVWLRANPARLLSVLLGLCLTCLALRLSIAWLHPDYIHSETFYSESQYRLDSIAFGVILALTCELEDGRRFVRRIARPSVAAGALIVVLLCLVVRDAWFRETLRYTALGCAIDVLVATVLFSEKLGFVHRILNAALLVWIGRLSYSLYVWHEGVTSFLSTAGMPLWQAATVKLGVSILVAAVSYYGVEQPFLRLRRYLPNPRPAPVLRPVDQRLPANSGV